jgi:hypothetical protein
MNQILWSECFVEREEIVERFSEIIGLEERAVEDPSEDT